MRFSLFFVLLVSLCACGDKKEAVQRMHSDEAGKTAESSKPSTDNYPMACGGLPGVRFSFPVYPGWEPGTLRDSLLGCTAFLSTPEGTPPPIARRMISAWRLGGPEAQKAWSLAKKGGQLGELKINSATENSHGVLGGTVFDAKAKADPSEVGWSYVQLYDPGFVIRVQVRGGTLESGFDRDAVATAIRESARFERPAVYELRARAMGKKLSTLRDERSKAIVKALPPGENADEFFAAKAEARGANTVVSLWHRSAFADEHLGLQGNPGGKSRSAIIAKDGTVRFEFWQ